MLKHKINFNYLRQKLISQNVPHLAVLDVRSAADRQRLEHLDEIPVLHELEVEQREDVHVLQDQVAARHRREHRSQAET